MGEQQALRLMPSYLVPHILKIDPAKHENDKIYLISIFESLHMNSFGDMTGKET